MGLLRRGRTWHYRKRVPRRFQDVDPRPNAWGSLHTGSQREAEARAVHVLGDKRLDEVSRDPA